MFAVLIAGTDTVLLGLVVACLISVGIEQVGGVPLPTYASALIAAVTVLWRVISERTPRSWGEVLFASAGSAMTAVVAALPFLGGSLWLGLVAPEDNEAWLSRMAGLRDGRRLSAGFSSEGIGPLTRLVLDLAAAGIDKRNDLPVRLTVLWIGAISLVGLLSAQIAYVRARQGNENRTAIGTAGFCGLLGCFSALQFARFGHLSFAIALAALLALILKVVRKDSLDQRRGKSNSMLAVLCLGFGLAYIPFYPLAVSSAVLLLAPLRLRVVRTVGLRVRVTAALAVASLIYLALDEFVRRYSGTLDTGGGTASVTVTGTGVLLLSVVPHRFTVRLFTASPAHDALLVAMTALLALLLMLARAMPAGRLSAIALVALLVVRVASYPRDAPPRVDLTRVDHKLWATLGLFGVFAAVIYGVSVLSGEIHEPMYAARKTAAGFMTAAQPILIPRIVETGRHLSRMRSSIIWCALCLLTSFAVGLLPIASRPAELSEQWWMGSVMKLEQSDASPFVACLEGDTRVSSHETYTCNRYLQAVGNDQDLSWYFRYFAWYGSVSRDQLTDAVIDRRHARPIKLIVRGVLSEDARAMIEAWRVRQVDVRIVEVE